MYPIRKYKRRYVRKGVRRVKKAMPTNMRKVANQVKQLRKRVNRNTATQHLFQKLQELQIVDAPYVYSNLTDWSAKSPVFATNITDWQNSNKIYHKSMTVDCRLTFGNEPDLISYRAFLVTLRDDANVPALWNSGTGGLALTNDIDFTQSSFGLGKLNPKTFKIHRVKTFYTFAGGVSPSSVGGNSGDQLVHQWQWKIKPRHEVYNPRGNVASLVTSQDPSKCYYIIIMTDNVAGDLQSPVFACAVNHTITTAM